MGSGDVRRAVDVRDLGGASLSRPPFDWERQRRRDLYRRYLWLYGDVMERARVNYPDVLVWRGLGRK